MASSAFFEAPVPISSFSSCSFYKSFLSEAASFPLASGCPAVHERPSRCCWLVGKHGSGSSRKASGGFPWDCFCSWHLVVESFCILKSGPAKVKWYHSHSHVSSETERGRWKVCYSKAVHDRGLAVFRDSLSSKKFGL